MCVLFTFRFHQKFAHLAQVWNNSNFAVMIVDNSISG